MSSPSAIFLLGTHCPHCPSVLQHLNHLIKKGDLSQLTIVNIESSPETAQKYGVRSVPWVKIGDYTLTGLQPLDALEQRVRWVKNNYRLLGDYDHMLSTGKAQQVVESINADNQHLDVIMTLLADPATVLSTRIGIGVVMEELEGSDLLRLQLEKLGNLLESDDNRVRADVAHYLSLTHSKQAIKYLQKHSGDPDKEVNEVIEDSLLSLTESPDLV